MSEVVGSISEGHQGRIFTPTATKQCWGFIIGSALFALGSAPVLGAALGSTVSNLCYFIGALFFTSAAFIQLMRSGLMVVPVLYAPGTMVRAEWLSAATQAFGTLMFNVSTTAALQAKTIASEKHLVWNPDAGGSVAFLVSGAVAFIAYKHVDRLWNPRSVSWWSIMINFIGCVAFGASAVGAFILANGNAADPSIANLGTFIGALCFLIASLIMLPQWPWIADKDS